MTKDGALLDRVRYLATQARQPAPRYEHTEIGYSYRLSNLLRSLGRGQLSTLGRIDRRRVILAAYAGLAGSGHPHHPGFGGSAELLFSSTTSTPQGSYDRTCVLIAFDVDCAGGSGNGPA